MHEAGIAASIIEIAEEAARTQRGAAGSAPIQAIGLRLGAFTGVSRDSLEFAFAALKEGTLAAGAELVIIVVPLTGECETCGWKGRPAEDYCFICPQCQSALDVATGREMQVEYVDLAGQERPEGETDDGTSDSRDEGLAQERGMRGIQPPFL
jgi:hydrogenase nickel incorporation protein HypA/HybF